MASSTSMLHLTHTLTLLFLLMAFPPTITSTVAQEAAPAPIMRPMSTLIDEGRRRLGSFQICALCTCCGGPRRLCLPSPCCYAINCNIPNRPFGFCSFTPKTCNCFGCHL